jgi:hypothetical protein
VYYAKDTQDAHAHPVPTPCITITASNTTEKEVEFKLSGQQPSSMDITT